MTYVDKNVVEDKDLEARLSNMIDDEEMPLCGAYPPIDFNKNLGCG